MRYKKVRTLRKTKHTDEQVPYEFPVILNLEEQPVQCWALILRGKITHSDLILGENIQNEKRFSVHVSPLAPPGQSRPVTVQLFLNLTPWISV